MNGSWQLWLDTGELEICLPVGKGAKEVLTLRLDAADQNTVKIYGQMKSGHIFNRHLYGTYAPGRELRERAKKLLQDKGAAEAEVILTQEVSLGLL